jgi:hypothetical protein
LTACARNQDFKILCGGLDCFNDAYRRCGAFLTTPLLQRIINHHRSSPAVAPGEENMRRPLDAALVLAVGALISTTAFACGDKLILTIGNLRFRQINGSARPASILAYTPRNSPVGEVLKQLEQQSAATRAGLTFQSFDDPAKLDEMLRADKYDLLLVDAGDADNMERQAQSVPSKPTVLPVVPESSKAAAAQAEKKFHCVLTAPNSSSRYLSAIDRAMDFKLKAHSRKGPP